MTILEDGVMKVNKINPGKDLYTRVKSGFVLRETSFTKWCQENQVSRTAAIACLMGTWDGPKGRILRARLVSEAGLEI